MGIVNLAVEVGAVPASPIRQVLTSRQTGCAAPQSSARTSLWPISSACPPRVKSAPGADGLTWADYAADLDRNLTDLHARVHSGAYRALPSRRPPVNASR